MGKQKVLIVGGAGYIGAHVNKLLSQSGFETVVFDNLSTGHREFLKWGEFFKGDLSNRRDIDRCLSRHSVGAVIQLAASIAVGESVRNPSKYYSNNLCNTVNLLNAMGVAGIKKLVFSSTAAVYGNPVSIPVTEEHPLAPINPYGRTKKFIEEILPDYEAAYGIKFVSLRYFNAAGADPAGELGQWYDSFTHLIPLVFNAALDKDKPLRIFGTDYPTPDGTCVRDYVHVSDLAQAHLLALNYLKAGKPSNRFNLGNGKGHSVREVISTVEGVSGLKVRSIKAARRAGDPPALVASSKRAASVLGWAPELGDLRQIVGTAWNWHNLISCPKKKKGRRRAAVIKH